MYNTDSFHFNVSSIGRGQGKQIAREAAYIQGLKINDEYYGLKHDYSYRQDVLHKEILLPHNAPHNFYDVEMFVNAIEQAESRKDSRIAKEVVVSLFNNKYCAINQALSTEDYVTIVRDFVTKAFISHGRCALIAIHEGKNNAYPEKNNPHAHVILSDRPVDENGFCLKKNREWIKNNVREWRELWAEILNKEFERKGLDVRVSAKSFIALGIKRQPTKHLGATVIALKKRGIETDRSIEYQRIKENNLVKDKQNLQQTQKRKKSRERGRELSR